MHIRSQAEMDEKALAIAQEIALMWGRDRSQFVSRIQCSVLDAMRWAGEAQWAGKLVRPEGIYDVLAVPEQTGEQR